MLDVAERERFLDPEKISLLPFLRLLRVYFVAD
jgi:hypothetical protein